MIDFDELIVACTDKSKLIKEENLDKIFKMIDSENTGFITERMLSEVFMPIREKQ